MLATLKRATSFPLFRDKVRDRFRRCASWRARKLFKEERELCDGLADRHPILKVEPAVQKELRREEQVARSKR